MRLVPQPPGRFRWVGTQTLLFEPEGERLPKATDYVVEVTPGTRTAAGRQLADARAIKFSLPPVKVESFHPDDGESTKLEPLRTTIPSAARMRVRVTRPFAVAVSRRMPIPCQA